MEPEQPPRSSLNVLDIEGHKIITTEVHLKSGEIAYFGFEPVFNEDREQKWLRYCTSTRALAEGFFCASSIEDLSINIDRYTEDPSSFYYKLYNVLPDQKELREYFSNLQKLPEKHEKELRELTSNLQKLPVKIDPVSKNDMYLTTMKGINSGCIGFRCYVENYVAYFSKKPIIGFFPFPDVAPRESDVSAYIDTYDNLIMVVSSSSTIDNKIFEHRGIFRYLMSVLRKDYQGIGILLHVLAASARSELYPEVEMMTVNPDDNRLMLKLLSDNFTHEESFRDGTRFYIKVEAVKKKFLAENIRPTQ